jgi:hypothetical protein
MKLRINITQVLAGQGSALQPIETDLPLELVEELQDVFGAIPSKFPKLRVKVALSLVTDDDEILPSTISSYDLEKFLPQIK